MDDRERDQDGRKKRWLGWGWCPQPESKCPSYSSRQRQAGGRQGCRVGAEKDKEAGNVDQLQLGKHSTLLEERRTSKEQR